MFLGEEDHAHLSIPTAPSRTTASMTRGRKKDMTIPPTRALTQQRDYRARRAQYVSDLEDKCHALEAENTCLRQEVAALRTRLPAATAHNPAVVRAVRYRNFYQNSCRSITSGRNINATLERSVRRHADAVTVPAPRLR